MPTCLSFQLAPQPGAAGADSPASADAARAVDRAEEAVRRAYLRAADRYRQAIESAVPVSLRGSARGLHYPSLEVDLPAGRATLVVDGELDRQLLAFYVVQGWDAIGIVGEALRSLAAREEQRREKPAGGVTGYVPDTRTCWPEADRFFLLTREVLVFRLRAALANVEDKVGEATLQRLGDSARAIAAATHKLQIREVLAPAPKKRKPRKGRPAPRKFRIADTEALQEIHLLFRALLVEQRYYERQQLEMRIISQSMQARRQEVKQRYEDLSGGVVLPEERQAADEAAEEDAGRYQSLKLESLGSAAMLERLSSIQAGLCPLLVLVVPQLPSSPTLQDTERAITGTWLLASSLVDRIARSITAKSGRVLGHVPADLDRLLRMELQFPASFHPTRVLAERALDALDEDPSQVLLLSEAAWTACVDEGRIQAGTLEHVVAMHYVADVMRAKEARKERDELKQAIAQRLAEVSAAMSLLAAMAAAVPLPQARAASVSLRTVAGAIDMSMAVFQVYSVMDELRKLDQALDQRLVDAGCQDLESMAAIADVLSVRASLRDQIGEEVLKMIAESLASKAFPRFKQYVHLRGYAYDIQSLIPVELAGG